MKKNDPFTAIMIAILIGVVVLGVISTIASSQHQSECQKVGGMVVKTPGGDKCVQLKEVNND